MIAPASRKLGKYEILRKLGRGGMADVYLAHDAGQNHTVALKLIEHASDPDTVDAIEAERRGARLQARLADIDPRVVPIYDAGDVDGFFFVAMEYVDGQDLSELLRNGPLQPEFATDVAISVAQTLENAHNLRVEIDGKEIHGIVHGDIKPKNIRIDSRGHVRVIDFGIAKALSLTRRLTRNEFGSVPYGSPERLEAGQVNELSDLWSLAVMLYEMVTGLQPYHAESTERLERMIRSRIPPPPAPPPCPDLLRRILMRAMAPEPEVRYQSAREFAEALRKFRDGEELEDPDATRRTFPRAAGAGDDTRRTTPDDGTRRTAHAKVVFQDQPAPAAQSQTWPLKKPAAPRKPLPLWMTRTIAAGLGATVILLVWLAGSDIMLYRRGQQLERDISTEQVTSLDDIWNRWTELSDGNASSWLLKGPRKAVRQKFIAAADHVIDSYRKSDGVYESSWKGARDDLTRALALNPDNEVRGKLRLTEGHLARINGVSHRSSAELNDAVEKFSEAEKLLPQSPDPELGLARVYVQGLKDIDKAYLALQEAQKRGFELGNREKSQLADGYRERGDRLFWDSRNVRGLPQEEDQIKRSKEDYERALRLYQGIAPWGNSTASVVRVQNSLEQVDSRLQQIEFGADVNPKKNPLSKIPHLVKSLVDLWQSHAPKQ
jgi:eukaryotic-like serine/threonine-protein kinase